VPAPHTARSFLVRVWTRQWSIYFVNFLIALEASKGFLAQDSSAKLTTSGTSCRNARTRLFLSNPKAQITSCTTFLQLGRHTATGIFNYTFRLVRGVYFRAASPWPDSSERVVSFIHGPPGRNQEGLECTSFQSLYKSEGSFLNDFNLL
jgi:hypothetical protein